MNSHDMREKRSQTLVEVVQLVNDFEQAAAVARWCRGMAVVSPARVSLHMPTLTGVKVAHPGDWIIRNEDKDGESTFDLCKPDAFVVTYESI